MLYNLIDEAYKQTIARPITDLSGLSPGWGIYKAWLQTKFKTLLSSVFLCQIDFLTTKFSMLKRSTKVHESTIWGRVRSTPSASNPQPTKF